MKSRSEGVACAAGPEGVVDLTDEVREIALGAGVRSGRVSVCVAVADASLFLNENETGLRIDLQNAIARASDVVPPSALGAASVTIPVVEGDLWLGAWQRVLGLVRAEDAEFRATVQVYGH
jgi:thiamine phosphate synthase YjbQ (UPF0047 family)